MATTLLLFPLRTSSQIVHLHAPHLLALTTHYSSFYSFPSSTSSSFLHIQGKTTTNVKANAIEGSDKLVETISGDKENVICVTGLRPSWDLLAPWKDRLSGGSVSRDQFAEVVVEALIHPESSSRWWR